MSSSIDARLAKAITVSQNEKKKENLRRQNDFIMCDVIGRLSDSTDRKIHHACKLSKLCCLISSYSKILFCSKVLFFSKILSQLPSRSRSCVRIKLTGFPHDGSPYHTEAVFLTKCRMTQNRQRLLKSSPWLRL